MPTGIGHSVVTPAFTARSGGTTEQVKPRERDAVAPATSASSESLQAGDERALLRAPDAATETKDAGPSENSNTGTESKAAAAQQSQVQERQQASGGSSEVGGSLDIVI